MSKQGVDYLFVTPSSDLTYLLGYPAHASERMTLLGVPREGEPFVVATLEATRLDNRRDIVDVHAWNETESPAELTARLLEHKGRRHRHQRSDLVDLSAAPARGDPLMPAFNPAPAFCASYA